MEQVVDPLRLADDRRELRIVGERRHGVPLPGAGGRASIISGSLEQSNVDLAEQFVRLIAAQRAFQAAQKLDPNCALCFWGDSCLSAGGDCQAIHQWDRSHRIGRQQRA